MLSLLSRFDLALRQGSVRIAFAVLGLFLAAGMVLAFRLETMGDSGDSLIHFLMAKGAWRHPELLLDHWGKPFFTLAASPFAQFGFVGMRAFQVLTAATTLWLVFLTARRMSLSDAPIAMVFVWFAPFYYQMLFSGLTEAFAGLLLIAGVYGAMVPRCRVWAAVLVSFLPFVRSEGLVLCGVFALYYGWTKQWKLLPWLAFGHVAYSLAGFPYHEEILWVFTKIPYAGIAAYDQGGPMHYLTQLNYIIGPILYLLVALGLLRYGATWVFASSKAKTATSPEQLWLVYGMAVAFIAAHTVFWVMGIFGTMGLKRVLNAIVPLLALIALQGWTWIRVAEERAKWLVALRYPFLLGVLILPFTENPAAINWKRDMGKMPDLAAVDAMKPILAQYPARPCYHSYAYAVIALNEDMFDSTRCRTISDYRQATPGSMIIWEDWFAPLESNVTLAALQQDPHLRQRHTQAYTDQLGKKRSFAVFEVIR